MRVAIVTTFADKVFSSRHELINSLIEKGHTLIVIGSEEINDNVLFKKNKIDYVRIDFERANINPYKEVKFIEHTKQVLKSIELDILIVYGVRLSASIALAAKLASIKKVYTIINGAGTLFNLEGVKGKAILGFSYPLLLIGLRIPKKVFFQNSDNRNLFIKLRLVKRKNTCIVNGSGVNLTKFHPCKNEKISKTFLFTGRMIKDKGIREFIEAAKEVKRRYPEYKFLIIGPFDENVTALSIEELNLLVQDGLLEHISWTKNMNKYMRECFVFVLPSYHEGIPRTTLEAMASAKPIITTNVPGCKETVINGMNGFLIPAKDSDELAKKMIWMIENRNQAGKMGNESLRLAKKKFDVYKINQVLLKTMGL